MVNLKCVRYAQPIPLYSSVLKGCGMGTLFVRVSPCFREIVVVTCKIGTFLCSLDNLLQKNVFVSFFFFFFFGNQISKWRSFEKKGLFLTYFSHFFSHQGKLQKFLQHRSHSHTYTYFAQPTLYWLFFCLTKFGKKILIYQVWFLFGMSPGWFLFAPFWNNQ